MRRMQTDPASARAAYYVPYLIHASAARPADTVLSHAGRLLATWDCRYTLENQAAVLFEAAMPEITSRLWDELPGGLYPAAAAFLALLDDPDNAWWDDRRTGDRVERRDDILAEALRAAYAATLRAHGSPEAGGWRWSRVHRIHIDHLLHLPSLSVRDVSVAGGPSTISPSSTIGGGEGSSWRMVVELGSSVRGWGTYPGGQSGNPASSRYDDRLAGWSRGELSELRFPPTAAGVRVSATLLLHPAR
jgi:penicillin amidase